jgi:hypothetical protein
MWLSRFVQVALVSAMTQRETEVFDPPRAEFSDDVQTINPHTRFQELFAADHDSLKDPVGTHLMYNQIRAGIKAGMYVCKSQEYDELFAMVYYVDFVDAVDESKVIKFLEHWLPEDAKRAKSPKDRAPNVEKIHAKSEWSRKTFTRVQVQDLIVKVRLLHFLRLGNPLVVFFFAGTLYVVCFLAS